MVGGEIERMRARLAKVLVVVSFLLVPVFALDIDNLSYSSLREFYPSAEVWSDNFDDLNADGWELWGWNATDKTSLPGSFSLSEGVLRLQGVLGHSSVAIYNTTQATGAWSFDLDVAHTPTEHFYVSFISSYWDNDSIEWGDGFGDSAPYEYGIAPVTGVSGVFENEFILYRRDLGSVDFNSILGRFSPAEIIGWHHLDVVRDENGQFEVYFNGTLQITAVDTTHTTTECFKFYGAAGPAIDNIHVYDSWPVDQDTTQPPDLLGPTVIGIGVLAIVVVIALVKRRS